MDELVAEITTALAELRVPDVSGMDPVDASCATWQPLVGNVDWATGALLERQFFIAHVAALAAVSPVRYARRRTRRWPSRARQRPSS